MNIRRKQKIQYSVYQGMTNIPRTPFLLPNMKDDELCANSAFYSKERARGSLQNFFEICNFVVEKGRAELIHLFFSIRAFYCRQEQQQPKQCFTQLQSVLFSSIHRFHPFFSTKDFLPFCCAQSSTVFENYPKVLISQRKAEMCKKWYKCNSSTRMCNISVYVHKLAHKFRRKLERRRRHWG